MDEKELLKILKNEDFMKQLIESSLQDDFYVTDKKPVYSLRQCLENIKEPILKTIYMCYKNVISKNIKSKASYEEMIDILEKEIPEAFSEFMYHLNINDKNIINDVIKNKKTKTIDMNLVTDGFLFGFKEKNENVYIIPNELLDIYKNYINSDDKKKSDLVSANMYIAGYLLMNGIVKRNFLENVLLNEYGLNVTKEQINEILSKNYKPYRDEYIVASQETEELNDLFDEIIKIQEQKPIIALDEDQMYEYLEMIHDLLEEIKKIFKSIETIDLILSNYFITYGSVEEKLNKFNFTKTQNKKLTELLETYEECFRYWILSGRTFEEYEYEFYVDNASFKEKPKFSDLKSCLKNLPDKVYSEIALNYNFTENLEEEILAEFKDGIECYDVFEIDEIISSNHNELTPVIDNYLLRNGIVYLYKDDNKTKCFIPDEILDILKKAYYSENNELYKTDLISAYINMNGIIEKEKLVELLKEYHNINISIKELDKIVEDIGAEIVNNKYYTWINDIEKKEINALMTAKNNFNKYKCVDLDSENFEAEFKDKLLSLLTKEMSTNPLDIHDVLKYGSKYGIINKEFVEFIFEDINLPVSKSLINKILELHKEYKKYISVWPYNGYSITEYNEIMQTKSEKIGRNEPCPCGSGKKYKKCCGK